MAKYAEGTEVPVERSKAEIDAILQRYGATARGILVDEAAGRALIVFGLHERHIRLEVALPRPDEKRFTHLEPWRERTPAAAQAAYDKELRRIWRVQILYLKAKLEQTADDADAFRREFLPHTLLPTGQTVWEATADRIDEGYRTGEMPPLLPPAGRALPPGKDPA